MHIWIKVNNASNYHLDYVDIVRQYSPLVSYSAYDGDYWIFFNVLVGKNLFYGMFSVIDNSGKLLS